MSTSLVVYYGLFILELFLGYALKKYVITQRNSIENGYVKKWNIITLNEVTIFILVFIMILIPAIICAIRYNVGGDYDDYERIFLMYSRIPRLTWEYVQSFSYEIGIWIVARIAIWLGGGYHEFLFLTAFLIYGFAIKGIIDSDDGNEIGPMVLIYLCLLYGPSFNIIKQMIAGSIIFWGFKFILQKKFWKYLIVVLAASLFHISAICFIALYFINFEKNQNSKIKAFIIISVAAILPFIFEWLFMRLTSINLFSSYYSSYSQMFKSSGTIKSLLLRLPTAIPLLIYHRKLLERDRHNLFYLLLLLFEYSFICMSYVMHWAFRMSYYFAFAEVVLYSRLLGIVDVKIKPFWKIYYILYYIAYFYMVFYIWGDDGLFPYITMFS